MHPRTSSGADLKRMISDDVSFTAQPTHQFPRGIQAITFLVGKCLKSGQRGSSRRKGTGGRQHRAEVGAEREISVNAAKQWAGKRQLLSVPLTCATCTQENAFERPVSLGIAGIQRLCADASAGYRRCREKCRGTAPVSWKINIRRDELISGDVPRGFRQVAFTSETSEPLVCDL